MDYFWQIDEKKINPKILILILLPFQNNSMKNNGSRNEIVTIFGKSIRSKKRILKYYYTVLK